MSDGWKCKFPIMNRLSVCLVRLVGLSVGLSVWHNSLIVWEVTLPFAYRITCSTANSLSLLYQSGRVGHVTFYWHAHGKPLSFRNRYFLETLRLK